MHETLAPFYPWMHLVGRVLFSMIFIMMGLNHMFQLQAVAGYAASRHVPSPKLATVVSGLMILVGGILLALGWHRFIGAMLIVIFCPVVAVMVHSFWKFSDPMEKQNEMAHFMKNMALAGGALFIAVYAGTTWPLSLGG